MANELVSAEELKAGLDDVQRLLRDLRRKLARGTKPDIKPFFVGDETTTEVLKDAVTRAIKARGMTLQELSDATGARRNRISGVLVKLQKDGLKIVNEGNGYRAIWRIK